MKYKVVVFCYLVSIYSNVGVSRAAEESLGPYEWMNDVSCAHALLQQGQVTQAKKLLTEAASRLSHAGGNKRAEGQIDYEFGQIATKEGKHLQAINFYKKVILAHEKIRPVDIPFFNQVCVAIAESYCRLRNFKEAENWALKTKDYDSSDPHASIEHGRNKFALANVYVQSGQLERARTTLNKLIEDEHLDLHTDAPQLIAFLTVFAEIEQLANKPEAVVAVRKHILKIERKCWPKKSGYLIPSLQLLAEAHMKLGQDDQARPLLIEAIDIAKHEKSPAHETQALLRDYRLLPAEATKN